MKAPWFPFYTGDFLASATVQDMEAHEVGAYTLLLARSWQSDTPGYLEDDEYAMRRAGRLTAEQWAQAKTPLLRKWPLAEDKPGYRYNPRLLAEAQKQVELRELKAEAGRKSAERRAAAATQRQQSVNTNPTPVENPATDVGKNGNYSQPQSQPQSQEGKPSSSSFQSEEAANAAASSESVEVEQPAESPTPGLRTPGGGGDVGTRKVRAKKEKLAAGSSDLADYQLPEWASDDFKADAAEWLSRRQSRTDVKPLQTAAIQEYFNELAGYTPEFCEGLFSESRKHPTWQGLTFRSTKLDFAQHVQKLQQLQAHAARQQQSAPGQSGYGNKPTPNAVALAGALARRRFEQPGGGAGDTGQTAGAYPGQSPVGAPGFGAH